ncbi:MAG TPA: helix-turn-helix domain-containing protein [Gemmatimonadales bacterium]|nr:helix-turn-helix domain-containing protein [Gemmatimonadales bacterium]
MTVLSMVPGAALEVVRSANNGLNTLALQERRAILERLESTGWRLAETARQLGISRTTLWRRLRAYGFTAEHRPR